MRIAVFAEWPYLYDGDLAYEERYLAAFAGEQDALLVVARDGDRIVGASTASPMPGQEPAIRDPVEAAGIDPAAACYFGESVLLPDWRGRGIGHAFVDGREAHARALGLSITMFAAVIRPHDHPSRPAGYRPLDGFWKARGYEPVQGLTCTLEWRDHGESAESPKALQFWQRRL